MAGKYRKTFVQVRNCHFLGEVHLKSDVFPFYDCPDVNLTVLYLAQLHNRLQLLAL